jgi:hypothetical protein
MDQTRRSVKTGGICLIIFSLAVIAVAIIADFIYLYPAARGPNLHLNMDVVRMTGLRDFLTYASVLPFFLVPGAVGVYSYLKGEAQGTMRTAMYFALFAAFAWVFDAMLWPSLNWYISLGYALSAKGAVGADVQYLVTGLNSFIHVFIGIYFKVFALSLWIWLVSWVGLRHSKLPAWLCYFGIVLAVVAWICLIIRVLFGDPLIIEYGVNFYPIADLWIFFLGCFMLARLKQLD